MIGIVLMGGLGNQLFQLALGLHLRQQGIPVALDPTRLARMAPGTTSRPYALGDLPHRLPLLSLAGRWRWGHEAPLLRSWRSNRDARRPWDERRVRLERTPFCFDREAPGISPGLVVGYWQHPGYIDRVATEMRALLQEEDRTDAPPHTIDLRDIQVGIQVRRGDLVSNPVAGSHHGLCSIDYYRRGRAWIESRIGRSRCLFVSDDPEWCQEHLMQPGDQVSRRLGGDLADLRLLGSCPHQVIANSTFGWWGAWLGRRPGSVTVAPTPWIAADPSADPLPSEWIRIPR